MTGEGIAVITVLAILSVSIFPHPAYAANNGTGSVGMSITPANLSIIAPTGGGIATGKQAIALTNTGNYESKYTLSLSTNKNTTDTHLSPDKPNNTVKLTATTGTLDNRKQLNDNEWGFNLDAATNDNPNTTYAGITPYINPTTIATGDLATGSTAIATTNVTFATKTTNLTPADTYSINLTYTLTAEEILPAPTIDRTTPAAYQYGDTTNTKWSTSATGTPTSFNSKTLTIQGTNFIQNATNVYLDINGNNQMDNNEQCTNVTVAIGGNSLTCTIPDETTNKALDPTKDAVYNLIVTNNSNMTPLDDKSNVTSFSYIASSICTNANPNSACQVDIDSNMIPIKYTGNETNPQWQKADIAKQGDWYNYEQKQWANTVTIKPDKLDTYKKAAPNTVIPESDILSYFVYIPRYSYEVMRPNAIDKYVTDQNFAIKFEKATDKKKTPIPTCNILNPTAAQMWKDGNPSNNTYANVLAKDYRQDCNSNTTTARLYPTIANKLDPTKTTWATHPAFTWQYTKAINGFDKTTELNGIWVGKFETTGSTTAPTIKPNSKHIGSISGGIGTYYDIAKSMGVEDKNNTGGNGTTITQNNNNLSTSSIHMLKNSEWGAAAYLSASKYGAGVNGVQINSANDSGNDGNNQQSTGYTGCGPNANGGTSTYTCATATDHQYQSVISQLASTANNPTGIYDMLGGAWEYVMGNLTTATDNTTTSDTSYFRNPTKPPYVDLYKNSDGFNSDDNKPTATAWSSDQSNAYIYNNDICAWTTCAGQAFNETKTSQAVSYYSQSWGGDFSYFPYADYPWSHRGGSYDGGSDAGLFYSSHNNGNAYDYYGFRVAAPAGASIQ